jgi:probable rRNA maturation factor
MPDPESSHNIVVIVDKPCWQRPISQWEDLVVLAVFETLSLSKWHHAAEISILLTDDTAVQKLNKLYRGQDKATNVLSFPSLDFNELARYKKGKRNKTSVILGDVALAYETIERESKEQLKSFHDHLVHLVVHGVLHLLGFDHEKDEDAAIMESLEIKILSNMKIGNPYEE